MTETTDNKLSNYIIQTINKTIEDTKNVTELSQLLQIDNISTPTSSGLTDFYYPTLGFQELVEISKVKRVPIPNELVEQYRNMQYTCFMGLFTKISRAWLTIDNLIFFWNFEDGSDICFYDNLNEAILAVELFRPKKDTFPIGVDYALCIATCNHIILLSVEFIRYTKGNGEIVNEMRLSSQPYYTLSADNLVINTIKASQNGRIFMGAKDGCLYEFYYQNQTGWFSSQTKRINLSHSKLYYFMPSFLNFNDIDSIIQLEIDESRNLVYTRSQNSAIQVFYLGINGLETSKICAVQASTIVNRAATIANTNNKHIFTPIVHLAALSRNESLTINLIAITQYGVRLYFSLNPFDKLNEPPSTFQLVHVRFSPDIDLNYQTQLGPIISGFNKNGLSLLINKKDEQNDAVLLLSDDLYLFHNQFKESKAIFDIDGRIWAVDEIQNENQLQREDGYLLNSIRLSSQLFNNQRRFVMITPQGCYIWNKLRPIDQMCYALIESNGPNSDLVRTFFNKIYSRAEACTICLAVALNHLTTDNRVPEWATKAYLIYGGNAEIKKRSSIQSIQTTVAATAASPRNIQQPQQQQQFSGFLAPQNPIAHDNTLINQSIMTNDTTMNSTRFMQVPQGPQQQQQQQQGPRSNFGFSNPSNITYINSPQAISTPISVRTKDFNLSGGSGSGGVNSTLTALAPQTIGFQQPQQQRFGQQQQQQQTRPQIQTTTDYINSEFELVLSGRYDALFIYVSRLLSPIWNIKLLSEFNASTTTATTDATADIVATFTDIDIDFYIEKLNDLKSFLESNFKYLSKSNLANLKHQNDLILNEVFSSLPTTNLATSTLNYNYQSFSINVNMNQIKNQFTIIPLTTSTLVTISNHLNLYNIQTLGTANVTSAGAINGSPNLNYDKLAIEIENQLVIYFKRYLDYLIEIFLLLKILNEHKYHFISRKLDHEIKSELLKFEYRDYFCSTYQLYEQLITALIHSYIDDNVSTDNLNKNLKNLCPSLFTNENAIYTKACEKIKQAMNVVNTNEYERKCLLNEAINLIKQISYINNLDDICKTLYSVRCYDAIFDLCLNAAAKRDPQNIALYYYKKGELADDLQGAFYYSQRAECYKYMLHCLTQLNRATKSLTTQQVPPNVPSVFDDSTQSTLQPLSIEQANDYLNDLIDRIVKSTDELAHVFLFNWMIDNNMKNELFRLKSAYLESFLQIKALSKQRNYLDLMCLYYNNKKDYLNAAKILASLAESSECNISLNDRIDYLTRSRIALQSSSNKTYNEEENELKDKLDVALIQEKIYKQLIKGDFKDEPAKEREKHRELDRLNSQLFDITTLYEIAEKFDLFECQLFIFKVSRHDDPKGVEFLWKNIIANVLEEMKILYPNQINEQKTTAAEAIIAIASLYVDDEKYFPLMSLLDVLEFTSLGRDYGLDWTPTLFRQLNIQFTQLLIAYDQLYQIKDTKWFENKSYLIGGIYSLIDLFIKAPNSTTDNDQRQFLRLSKDFIPRYLIELQTLGDEYDLIGKFKTLKHVIERK